MFDRAKLVSHTRHSIDHTGFLVLSDSAGTGMAHLQETCCTVTSHPGQNGADGVATGKLGH